jgi:hypothetical protein
MHAQKHDDASKWISSRSEPIKHLPKHWTRYFLSPSSRVPLIYLMHASDSLSELYFLQMTVMVTKGQPVEK